MKFQAPEPLRHEHAELHTQLAKATALGGPVGDLGEYLKAKLASAQAASGAAGQQS